MKALLFWMCVTVLAAFCSGSIKEKLREESLKVDAHDQACMDEHHLTNEEWYTEDDIVHHRYAEPENEERTRKNGCTAECSMRKHGLMEGTHLVESNMHTHVDEEFPEEARPAAHHIMNDCMKQVKHITDGCHKSFSLYICVMKGIHDLPDE